MRYRAALWARSPGSPARPDRQGRAVVARVRAPGSRVHAHARPDSPQIEPRQTQFLGIGAAVETTTSELGAMTEALRRSGAPQRFARLAMTRARARGAAPADEHVELGLTLMLLEAAVAAGNRPRFVDLSAAGVHGPHDGNAYMRARGRVEAAVQASGRPSRSLDRRSSSALDRDETRPIERAGAAVTDATLGLFGASRLRARYRYRSTSNTVLAAASPPTHARRTTSCPRRTCTIGHVPKASNAGSCASLARPMDRIRTPGRTDVRTSLADSSWLPKPLHASASAGPSARSPGSSTSRTSSAAPACASPKPSGPTTGIASNIAHGAPKPNIVARWAFIAAR